MKRSAFEATVRGFCCALVLVLAIAPMTAGAGGAAAPAQQQAPPADAQTLLKSIVKHAVDSPLLVGVIAAVLVTSLIGAMVTLKAEKRRENKPAPNKVPRTKTTEAKRKNVDLEKRYLALFENANDFILGATLDGRLLYANNAWQETLDFNEEDIAALSIFQIVHSESLENFQHGFQRAVAGVKIKNLETTFLSKYGKRVIVEGSLHCEIVDDEPVAIQGVFRDITERKRSASALKQSENRFSRVFAASPVAIGICTLEEGKLQDVNDSFLNMLRYQRHEVVGNTETELRLWANPEDRKQIVQKLNERQSVRDAQYQLRTKKGEIREALLSAELIEINSETCLLLIIHDNTERLNLESQLRQAQKMEGIGQLAAGVAHDFNNILTIIQGHAGRLRHVEGVPPQIGESVEQVSVAADRAANLTRQLLTFCRKQSMMPKVMDLNETVTHVSKMLNRILGEDVALELNLGKAPFISADSGMIELAIINMACNSRDAMPKGGTLTIATSFVDITKAYVVAHAKSRVGGHVCLTITDSGSGMDPETLRRIFEPFFTTKEVGKGTGLGLATVYGIVDQHRGWIEVSSQLRKGTTFKIYLPEADKDSVKAVEESSRREIRKGKETILLVEDEVVLRELAKAVLEEYEYKVLEAGSGVQALKVWEQHKDKIDMLLTDMVMPEGMTGRDLAERIQKEKPGIKVLYSSGYSPDVIGGSFKLPENAFFLAKPYHPPMLAQAVRECLDNVRRPKASTDKQAQPA